jgi:hypothetical protein
MARKYVTQRMYQMVKNNWECSGILMKVLVTETIHYSYEFNI